MDMGYLQLVLLQHVRVLLELLIVFNVQTACVLYAKMDMLNLILGVLVSQLVSEVSSSYLDLEVSVVLE